MHFCSPTLSTCTSLQHYCVFDMDQQNVKAARFGKCSLATALLKWNHLHCSLVQKKVDVGWLYFQHCVWSECPLPHLITTSMGDRVFSMEAPHLLKVKKGFRSTVLCFGLSNVSFLVWILYHQTYMYSVLVQLYVKYPLLLIPFEPQSFSSQNPS